MKKFDDKLLNYPKFYQETIVGVIKSRYYDILQDLILKYKI